MRGFVTGFLTEAFLAAGLLAADFFAAGSLVDSSVKTATLDVASSSS
ncbi:MAG: hypothetical protein ACO3T8_00465 [Candidatus Nanopelagicales bacterium]